ncbi:MAG: GAP family protein [Chloroflexota bacterium]|nr:GAP family protein [Chloroflexota bacterium]
MLTLSLVGGILGIAVVDSLNPSLFLGQMLLFTTRRPLPRLMAYMVGLLVVNFIAGILLVLGIGATITDFIASIDPAVLLSLQIAFGAALLIFGLRFKPQPIAVDDRQPPVNLWKAFLFGVVVMVNEMTTAIPLVIAAERIAGASLSLAATVLLLIMYNLIFALPLLGFIGAYLSLRERFTARIDAINRGVQMWMPRLTRWFALGIGAVLVVQGILQAVSE